jgi:hypothetical protein
MKITLENTTLKFLILLISADFLFIAFHIAYLITTNETNIVAQSKSIFNLGKDMGLAETYQYVKEYWIAILLAYLAWTRREVMYLSWSLLTLYLLVDDLFQVHERVGRELANYFEMIQAFGLRAQDFGELAVVAVIGGILLSFVALAYWKSSPRIRIICHHFLLLLVFLAIFGVFFDLAHVISLGNDFWWNIFGIIEDGGEMIIISIFCWYVYYLSGNDEPILIEWKKKG